MKRLARIVLVLIVSAAWSLSMAPAWAGCHAFTFGQPTYSVGEAGPEIAIAVRHDAAVAPSSVRIRTADIEASANDDYKPLANHLVEWTASDGQGTPEATQKTVKISIVDDTKDEPDERFRVEFVPQSGGGCNFNPNFQYGTPTTVTIQDNDEPAPPPAATSPKPSPSPSPSPTKSPSPSPSPSPEEESPSPTEEASPTPEVVTTQAADEGDDGGLSTGVIVALAAAIVAVGAGGGLLYLRRRGAQPPPVDGV